MEILVTGGAGFIGAHTILHLVDNGFSDIVVIDNLDRGHYEVFRVPEIGENTHFYEGDIGDAELLDKVFESHNIAAVIHFAAYAYVGESVGEPLKYYRNNVSSPLVLLEAMLKHNCKKFIFSSTCATYGIPKELPITEQTPQQPINPYGRSKWMLEQVLGDLDHSHDLKSVSLRYFNASGSDPEGRIGECHDPEPHLIPRVLMAGLGEIEQIDVFGTNYPTEDGTCIRDYIHVMDLADGHLKALEYLENDGDSLQVNLGTGTGFSVNEIIATAESVMNIEIPRTYADRRPGDPPSLVANADLAREKLKWEPRYLRVNDHIKHALKWFNKGRHYTERPTISATRAAVKETIVSSRS